MSLRFGRRQCWIIISLGAVLLLGTVAGASFIETEYRATLYAQPVAADDARSPVSVHELPVECQPVARQLFAGRTVSEQDYELWTGGPPLYITHTNSSNRWQLSNVACGEQILTGSTLTSNGQYYHVWGTERKGKFWYRHKSLLSLSAVTGALLMLGGLRRGTTPENGA